MSSGSRTFLIVFGVAVMLLAGAVIAFAIGVHQCGMLHVEVHERGYGGEHVSIHLPGACVPLAMLFVPDHAFGGIPPEVCQMGPVLQASIKELSRMPDFVVVELRDGNEHVRVAKEGRALVVDVEEDGEEVHISVPLKVLASVAKKFGRMECRTGSPRLECLLGSRHRCIRVDS